MAEDFNHIDQIIRQKFENFEPEPPLQVWENIKAGISKSPPPPPSTGILLPIIVAVSLLIFMGGLFHHFYTDASSNGPDNPMKGVNIQTASLGSTGSTSTSDNTLQEEFYQTPSEINQTLAAPAAPDQPEVNTIPVRKPFEQTMTGDKKKKSPKSANKTTDAPQVRTGQWKPGLVQAVKSGELSYSDAKKYDLTMRDLRKFSDYQEYSKKKLLDWSVGLYFNPEVTSCQDENINNTISYNLSILPGLNFNHFFIQTGLNARFTHDKGNMAVDYNRFLGTYEDVYLVTFDSTENGIIPTYHTNTVEVYDTISHYVVSETRANYTYLEVPVLFGYRYNFGKFSLFAKAGPAASFMIAENIPEADYPEDHARIINVDYQIPLRSTINWQLMMGAGFGYQLADKVSFSLEPTFRFALKPEFDLQTGSDPKTRSFGVRAGLIYNF